MREEAMNSAKVMAAVKYGSKRNKEGGKDISGTGKEQKEELLLTDIPRSRSSLLQRLWLVQSGAGNTMPIGRVRHSSSRLLGTCISADRKSVV